MTKTDEIWLGDKLNRRGEATLLEWYLTSETSFLRSKGRQEALVLAIDARYGEGKSWFLSRFRQQLELNHPVAFVDAWVDDANQEPLVAIMSALNGALEPYFDKPNIREKMATLSRVALPLIGRAMIAAAGNYAASKLGEEFGDEARAAVKSAATTSKDGSQVENGAEAAVTSITERVSELVDGYGEKLLSSYQDRQKSRAAFKANLRALGEALDSEDIRESPPIFVVIDELDRCRPTYAISLLEEIKHLFDVPGIVFIIALHGDQLTKSINAVYGEGFDSQSYLRRFFYKHYKLRKLSIDELVISHFHDAIPSGTIFSSPKVFIGGVFREPTPTEIVCNVMTQCEATPRETLSVIDALRAFCAMVDKRAPIELPLALLLIMNSVRGDKLFDSEVIKGGPELGFLFEAPSTNPSTLTLKRTFDEYRNALSQNITELFHQQEYSGNVYYFGQIAQQELIKLHNNKRYARGCEPKLSWVGYADIVQSLGSLLLDPADSSQ